MIDAHCHIDLYPDPLAVAMRCEQAGLSTLAMTNLPSHFQQGIRHLHGFKHVRLALGMHPLYADRHEEEYTSFAECFDMTSYIGEIGLDFSREGIQTKDIQLRSFKYILEKVHGKKKLLSIHSRCAEKEVLELLVTYKIKMAIFHWYSGSANVLKLAAAQGYYFSVNPAMIKSNKGAALIAQIPKKLFLTETDGPFVQCGNRVAEPSDVKLVIEYVSRIWKVPINDAKEQIAQNFKDVLKLLR
ncbi:Qat anti-phage system TatD family nuclease QatD [uncultured Pontibacter sp.]|uniref:Qat anti-phage system TatD family nuclease QatD n=1 Tax=uncultured Pontibacter sp. TaxID=453356 RepID=UPI00262AA576|nr:Qat anti-phage system TatD family nuclease QatD [uncultured Pontibacter sp.]